MSYKLIRLSAGLEMRVDIPGRLILVDSVSTGQGVDISLLQTIFQHSSQAVTLRYIDITQENINNVYKRVDFGF